MLFGDILSIGLVLAIFYFLILRPQNQERSRHENLLASLSKDMYVVTRSGIHGTVVTVGDETVVLKVGDKTQLTVDKVAIFRRADEQVDSAALGV